MLILIFLRMCLCAVECFLYYSCCDQGQMNEYQINCGIESIPCVSVDISTYCEFEDVQSAM